MAPSTMQALVADTTPSLTNQTIPIPTPEPHQLLVKISHTAQNPTDVQSYDGAALGSGAVYGCDFVGTVAGLGEKVERFEVGDVVAGLIWGGEIKGLGAYAEYTVADEAVAFKVPEAVGLAGAATVPLAVTTAWLALFSTGCLDIDRRRRQSVLIWASVGQYAIQLARIHGFDVVTTCSPRNFELVKSLGATAVVDYNDGDVVRKIREAAPDLRYVFDTIGNKTSSGLGCSAAREDCTMCTVRPGKANTDDVPKLVKITDVLVWTAFLKEHRFGKFHWPASQEDHDLCRELYDDLPKWLQEGKIKTNAVVSLNGLKAVPEGFQMHRDGKLSAQKIVYKF